MAAGTRRGTMQFRKHCVVVVLLLLVAFVSLQGLRKRKRSAPTSSSSLVTTSGRPTSAPSPRGLMGYRTPNIDRLAKEGMTFTDYYAEQSCTAGRSSFITGQCVFRTGLSKVGLPAAPVGLHKEDPTIAEMLKPLGTPPASSARTTSATETSSCRRSTASMNSSATSTISTPRKSRSFSTTRRTRSSVRCSVPAACCGEGHEQGRPDRGPALRQGRQTDHRGYRAADAEADGDDRR